MSVARLYNNRLSPMEIIKSHLINSSNKTKYQETSHDQLAHGQVYRVFNDFPILISAYQFENQVKTFLIILNDVSSHQLDQDQVRMLSNWDKKQIANSVIRIATLACHSLIKENKVNPELIELLDWHAYENKIDTFELICAFVGQTYLYITDDVFNHPSVEIASSGAITNYLSTHYAKWVITALDRCGITHNEKRASQEHVSRNEPSAFAFGLTAALTGAAIGIGSALFYQYQQSPTREEKKPEEQAEKNMRFLYD